MTTALTFSWVMKELARQFLKALDGHALTYAPKEDGALLNEVVGGVVMTERPYVEIQNWKIDEKREATDEAISEIRGRYIEPAAQALANAVKRAGVTTISDLGMGQYPAVTRIASQEEGVSIRGVYTPDGMVRFDLIGGHA